MRPNLRQDAWRSLSWQSWLRWLYTGHLKMIRGLKPSKPRQDSPTTRPKNPEYPVGGSLPPQILKAMITIDIFHCPDPGLIRCTSPDR